MKKSVVKALRSQATGYVAGRFRCQLSVQTSTPSLSQCDCGRRKVVSLTESTDESQYFDGSKFLTESHSKW